MKTNKISPVKVLDQLDVAPLSLAEDYGFEHGAKSYSSASCASCRSCGGGCYGCYTPDKKETARPYARQTASKLLR